MTLSTSHGHSFSLHAAICCDIRSRGDAAGSEGRTVMKVRPLHDRVIVERIDEGEQKVGGIIIPDTAKEKPQEGKVITAGKGKVEKDGKVTPLDVKAGDTILFGKYAGQ